MLTISREGSVWHGEMGAGATHLPHEADNAPARRTVPYAGGFILSERTLGGVTGFTKRELPNGFTLWRDDVVAEKLVESSDGSFLLIRGHWALTSRSGEGKDTAQYLLEQARNSMDEFHEELDFLSGRYVIVLSIGQHTYVYNDAIGARTVCYSATNRLVASHLNLLAELDDYEKDEIDDPKDVQWAADFSPLMGVYHLLPNHRLELPKFGVSRFYSRKQNPYFSLDREEKYLEIERIWKSSQRAYFKSWSEVAFSISGGIDSRLVLAMAKPYSGAFARKKATRFSTPSSFNFKRSRFLARDVQRPRHGPRSSSGFTASESALFSQS